MSARAPVAAADTAEAAGAQHVGGLDVYRGLAILAVVGIHVTGSMMARYATGTSTWLVFAAVGRACLFAVPAFLMLSALLLTRRLLDGEAAGRFYAKRARSVLWPYLLWSALCALIAQRVDPGSFTWAGAAVRIATGKSFYHLYFLGVLLQLCLALPVLALLFRRRPPFGVAAAAAVVVTIGFFALNRHSLHLPYVGSIVFWYTPTIALGMWLGSLPREALQPAARRLAAAGLPVAAAALAGYLPLALADLRGQRVNTLWFQLGEWAYTAGASAVLLWLALRVADAHGIAARVLAGLGMVSMQVYLVHPLVVRLLDRTALVQRLSSPLIVLCLYVVLALAVPLALARAAVRVRASALLFGR